jgi:hypothetical protein
MLSKRSSGESGGFIDDLKAARVPRRSFHDAGTRGRMVKIDCTDDRLSQVAVLDRSQDAVQKTSARAGEPIAEEGEAQ